MAAGGHPMSGVQVGPRDALHPSRIMTYVLLGWAITVYHRPYLPELLPSYAGFTAVMPWPLWGYVALIGALLLHFTRSGTFGRLLAHAWAATFFLMVAGTFTDGVGVTSAGTTYTILGYVSIVLWARNAVAVASNRAWWGRLVNQPPRIIRWLAEWGRDGRD